LIPSYYQATVSPKYIEAPLFGWLSCEPYGSEITTPEHSLSKDGNFIDCSELGVTKGCTIKVKAPAVKWYEGARSVCYEIKDIATGVVSGGHCFVHKSGISSVDEKIYDIELRQNEVAYVVYMGRVASFPFPEVEGVEGASYFLKGQPYALWKTDTLRGGKTVLNAKSCAVPSLQRSLIVIDSTIEELVKAGEPVFELEPDGPAYNYISGFVTRPGFETEIYDGKLAYCVNGIMYGVEEVDTSSGTYYVVNSEYNDRIGTVDCCDGDACSVAGREGVCQNHECKIVEEAECSILNPCMGSEWHTPVEKEKIKVRYACIEGKCVRQEEEVECNDYFPCEPGYVCEDFKCVKRTPLPPIQPYPVTLGGILSVITSKLFLLSVLVAGITFLFSLLLLKGRFPEERILILILSALIGIIVGIAFYFWWWVGLIVVSILAILKLVEYILKYILRR